MKTRKTRHFASALLATLPASLSLSGALLSASLTGTLLSATSPTATAKSIVLPPDGAQLTASPLPGYAKAQTDCVACHSAEYMLYQPPTAPRAYWELQTRRMHDIFKAPMNEADIPDIVDYLVKTYGAEKPRP